MTGPYEREMEALEHDLDRALMEGDDEEAKAVQREIRELQREESEQARWEEEGRDRGWY